MSIKEEWAEHIHRKLCKAREELKRQEKELFEEALMLGNHTLAAKAMGISKRTLYYKVKEYGFDTRNYKGQWSDPDNVKRRADNNQNKDNNGTTGKIARAS